MKKKLSFLSILLALCLCAGCGKSTTINTGSTTTKESTTKALTEKATKEDKTTAPSKTEKATKETSATKENFLKVQNNPALDIRLTDSKFVKSDDDNIIVFDMEFTNKGKKDINLGTEYTVTAFQSGRSIDEAILYDGYNWSDEFEKLCTPLKRNESTTIKYACHLADNSMVTITVFDYESNVYFVEDIAYKTTGATPEKNVQTSCEYSDYRLSKIYDNDTIFMKFKFTNGTDTILSPAFLYTLIAYQNGISLEESIITNDSVETNTATPYTYILPGYTVEIEYGFTLEGRTNVTYDLIKSDGNDDKTATGEHEIKLDGGEGIKADNTFTTQAKLVKSQTIEENGEKYLLVAVDIYNGENHALYFNYNYTANAMQNGTALSENYTLNPPEDFDNYSQYRYIKQGYKHTVYIMYKLNDTSDVNFEIKEDSSGNVLLSETITP